MIIKSFDRSRFVSTFCDLVTPLSWLSFRSSGLGICDDLLLASRCPIRLNFGSPQTLELQNAPDDRTHATSTTPSRINGFPTRGLHDDTTLNDGVRLTSSLRIAFASSTRRSLRVFALRADQRWRHGTKRDLRKTRRTRVFTSTRVQFTRVYSHRPMFAKSLCRLKSRQWRWSRTIPRCRRKTISLSVSRVVYNKR